MKFYVFASAPGRLSLICTHKKVITLKGDILDSHLEVKVIEQTL